MSLFATALRLSQEDLPSDGVKRPEPEYVYYGHIENFAQLLTVPHLGAIEHQEQVAIKRPNGAVRIRKTVFKEFDRRHEPTEDGLVKLLGVRTAPTNVFTLKTKDSKEGEPDECNIDVTDDAFEMFKRLSDTGMRKYRIKYPAPGFPDLTWEIDFYYDVKRSSCYEVYLHPWVKIDLEVKQKVDGFVRPDLPLVFAEVLCQETAKKDSVLNDRISALYEKYFLS